MGSSPEHPAMAPIAARVLDPGYTPGIRDLAALLDLFGDKDDELARAAERAVLRIEARHVGRLVSQTLAHIDGTARPARGRIAKLLGRVAATAPEAAVSDVRTWLVGALADADPKTRHTAARALGKLRPSDAAQRGVVELALLEAWDKGGDDDRHALADALGKIGSKAARERLARANSVGSDHGLTQRTTRAALMIDRAEARDKAGTIDPTRSAEGPTALRFHARAGLETIVSRELGDAWQPRTKGHGLVDAQLDGPLAKALAIRTALHFGFPLDAVPVREELAEAIVRAIMQPRALAILRTFTKTDGGPIRFRLAWTRGGHRRALAWRCAELIAAATSELVNDPTASTWEIVVDDYRGRVAIELVPRGFVDQRFAYRTQTVAASSHPTIAAALARLVIPREDDVVWDPFVGAGAELVERARLGPYKTLLGTDTDPAAIEAARTNLAAAGITDATLQVTDATVCSPNGVTLIITNPPMGRRVQRGTHSELLERFVDHAAQLLVPGGALVWAAPDPKRLHARASLVGLVLDHAFTVDMGGFPAELCVYRKATASRPI